MRKNSKKSIETENEETPTAMESLVGMNYTNRIFHAFRSKQEANISKQSMGNSLSSRFCEIISFGTPLGQFIGLNSL